ncbi:MAG: DUF1579 domain-containing protein [Bacteroidetes bacterium]|nr:DUF1579 domain-containing protein [Bacteroidota bacterium]
MKTIKILAVLMAISGSSVFAQDTLNTKMNELINTDQKNAVQNNFEREKQERAKADAEKRSKEAKQAESKKAEVVKADQAKPADAPMSDADRAMMDYMTPGDMQKLLAEQVGEWNEKVTFWMSPDAPPMVSTAKCTTTMILGGRYQKSVSKGKMMGMDFEGQGTIGYDKAIGKFQSMWIDNFGTGIMVMEGKYNPNTKIFTLSGKTVDPVTRQELDARETMKMVSNTEMLMEMYVKRDNVEYKTMEIVFTRVVKKK